MHSRDRKSGANVAALKTVVVEEFRDWAQADGGPLMIGTREGGTKLALFEGMPQSSRPTVGFHRVAFRVGIWS